MQETQAYYGKAYDGTTASDSESENPKYIRIAESAAKFYRIEERVAEFVRRNGLEGKRVLDVGAGRGYLQDLVENYTALDISPTAGKFFHKRYVRGSATAMPFSDNEFDAAWSIWVLEHVPNPEQALSEIRRVVRDGGYLYLAPAWDCEPWPAQGYEVRPYSDFGLGGRIEKATIPAQRILRRIGALGANATRRLQCTLSDSPTVLRYRKLEPNYSEYWQPDSDAVNSLGRREVAQWFTSRGDECLNCPIQEYVDNDPRALIIRIRKPEAPRARVMPNPTLRLHRVPLGP